MAPCHGPCSPSVFHTQAKLRVRSQRARSSSSSAASGRSSTIVAVSRTFSARTSSPGDDRSEEHTSELQSLRHLVYRLLLEKKKQPTQLSNSCSAPAPARAWAA